MAPNTFPTKAEPAAVTTRHGLIIFSRNNSIGQIDDYHIQVPGV
jgi:hypothetical protein